MVLILVMSQLPANIGTVFGESTSEPSFNIIDSNYDYTGFDEKLNLELLNTELNGEGSGDTVALSVYGLSTPLDESGYPLTGDTISFQIEMKSTVIETVYGDEYTPDFELIDGYFVDKEYEDLYYSLYEDMETKPGAEKAIPIDKSRKNMITLEYDGETVEFYWQPGDNISGSILDKDGYPLKEGEIVITDDKGGYFEAVVDYEGNFKIALVDGNYALNAVTTMFTNDENGGIYFINKEFKVQNEEVVLVNDENPLENIELPAPNVEIKLTRGGDVFQGKAEIEFVFEMDDELIDPGVCTKTGVFDFYLTPGTYDFKKLWASDESINEHIEVENLELVIDMYEDMNLTGENAIEINLDDLQTNSSNTILTLQYEDGTPLDEYWIQIRGIDNYTDYWVNTDISGKVYEYLEPGLYAIGGYEKNENFKELNYEFEITSEHTIDNKFEEVIIVKLPNVKGVVKDTNNSPIPYAWVGLEKLPNTANGEIFSRDMGFNADEDGEFEIYLEAGEYIVRGIWNNNTQEWQEVNFTFEVIEGETITDLVVQKPQDNVAGYVFKKYDAESGEGIPFDGGTYYAGNEEEDFNHVWLVLREANVSDEEFNEAPWLYEKWIHVEADGSFSEYLDKGKSYEAFAVSTPSQYVELNPNGENEVIINPPELDLVIVPPVPNFGGQLLDFEGNPIPNAFINLEKADYTEWFGTETDEDGYFGLSLKTGEEYIIRDVSYRLEDGQDPTQGYYDYSKERRINFNKHIVIGDSTADLILKPNLKGNLDIGDIEIEGYDYVGISIRKILSEDDTNYGDYEMNPWKYESWINVNYEAGSNIGEFTGYFEDGRYEIVGVSDPNGWKQLGIEFLLDKSSNGIVTYDSGKENYELNINYAPNVSGIVLDRDGNPEADAWINIERIVEEEYYDDTATGYNGEYYQNRWFGANTNSSGEFSIKLTDGDYKVTGYSTTGYWDGDTWLNGKWVSVYYEFKIVNGELADINSTPISKVEIKPNVSGYVEKYNRDTDSFEVVPYSWMKIKPADENGEVDYENWIDDKWANSNENGEFTLMLQPGKYKVVEAGGHDLWMQLSIDFEIDSAGNLVDNDNVIDDELIVRSQKPNLKGYVKDEDGNILPNGNIAIKPLAAGEHDWNNVKWIETDDEGYFELKIDDGDWKVAYISAPGTWMRTYIPFTIDGENISSEMDGIVQDGLIEVKPPTPNLVGIVKDEEGNQIDGRAWLSIKPADAGVHDWENSHWIEYKEYDSEYKFKYYMEPGEYKVVNVGSYNLGYETDIRFEIGSNGELISSSNVVDGELIITPPEPNVIGAVFTEVNSNEEIVNNGWIGIARFDAEGNQLTMEGQEITEEKYYNEDDLYWNHTKWTMTDENGSFDLRLEKGLYKVISVSGNGVWYKADTEFTVVDGQTTNVEVRKPGANVTIIINNTGLNDNEAWIDIQMNKDGYKHYIPAELKSNSNGQYVFEARLEEGQYLIKSFGTPSYWTEVEHEFAVTNEELQLNVMVDFNNETKKKVSGQVKQGAVNVNEKVWVAIQSVVDGNIDTTEEKRWIQTTEDGSFTFKLDAGETWAVTDITTSDGYNTVTSPLNHSITVGDNAAQSPTEWIIDLDSL